MRQTLLRIFLDEPWALWKVDPVTGLPGPGAAILVLIAFAGWLAWSLFAGEKPFVKERRTTLLTWAGVLIAVSVLPMPVDSFPIFGYGFMLLIGFMTAMLTAQRRAIREGIEPAVIFDIGFWVLVCGIAGARVFYLYQYSHEVFAGKQGLDVLKAAVNLSNGGIVLYGALLGGTAAYFGSCWKLKINALNLADVAAPSVFIGLGFGRIGCLLNGCCYGGRCDAPWAITFAERTVPWSALVDRGFLDPTATSTYPLHPTQIYSSINGFLLAWLLAAFFPHRRHAGEVFALGCIIYPITRFIIEFLRADELGQLGTGLTISQLVSLGICAVGVTMMAVLSRRPTLVTASGGR